MTGVAVWYAVGIHLVGHLLCITKVCRGGEGGGGGGPGRHKQGFLSHRPDASSPRIDNNSQ